MKIYVLALFHTQIYLLVIVSKVNNGVVNDRQPNNLVMLKDCLPIIVLHNADIM